MLRFERLGAPAQGVVRLLAAGQRVEADPDGSYAVRHALLREVVEDDLLPGERAALHARYRCFSSSRVE